MRSLLFTPGNKENMLEKAIGSRADVLVPDMEDSVADGDKAAAREQIAKWLPRLAEQQALLMPRVNSLRTEWFEVDVAAVATEGVWGLSIGKVESAADISTISQVIAKSERAAGLDVGRLKLIPWIETALAIENCFEICRASDRIAAVAFGGEDYTWDLGVERLDDESNLVYQRSTICNAARAAGIPALDTPYFQFRDPEGLKTSCQAARRLGFKGRFAIHPAQIETIIACFSPSAAEIDEARRILAAFGEAEERGRGSTSLDGRVIDVPVVRRARALLEQAGETE
ncbi:MAG: CoA ester lyase [Gammaproteobacteria bacterium]|jgi:citrate lyase subunit beta/citryl-CoA lyase